MTGNYAIMTTRWQSCYHLRYAGRGLQGSYDLAQTKSGLFYTLPTQASCLTWKNTSDLISTLCSSAEVG